MPIVRVDEADPAPVPADGRDAAAWKLDGRAEYDVRRPRVPTGTNLLGLVKHLTCVELGYFGLVFGRPMAGPNPWFDDGAEDNADLFARADERDRTSSPATGTHAPPPITRSRHLTSTARVRCRGGRKQM